MTTTSSPASAYQSNSRSAGPGSTNSRQMPNNIEAEQCLIGSMLLNRDAISSAIEMRVGEQDYYKPAHGELHGTMTMYNRGEAVDEVTLMEQLRRDDTIDKVGGKPAILALQAAPPSSTNSSYYAKIVTDLSQLRAMIMAANDIAEMGYGSPESIPNVLDRAETMIFDVAQRQVSDSLVSSHESVAAAMTGLEEMYGETG